MTQVQRRSPRSNVGCGRIIPLFISLVVIAAFCFSKLGVHSDKKAIQKRQRMKVGGATVVVKSASDDNQSRDTEDESQDESQDESYHDRAQDGDDSDDSEDGVVVTFESDEESNTKFVAFGRSAVHSSDDQSPERSRGYRSTGGHLPKDVIQGMKKWDTVNLAKCLKHGEPDIPREEWKRRAPHFLTLGHHKSGTQALTNYLWQHPQIVQTNRLELFFFVHRAFEFVSPQGIDRSKGRELYQDALMKYVDLSPPFETSKMVTFDSTPRYFLDSDRNPHMILCIAPWAKLLVLFRNPIERVESHYNYLNQARVRSNKPMVGWREWINDDLESLRKAGVVDTDRSPEQVKEFAGSSAEVQAWTKYTRTRNSQFVVGRGLYSIQLRQWYAVMDKFGKDRKELLVIQSERLKKDTQGEYSRILRFLGLDDHILNNAEPVHESDQAEHMAMPEDVRRDLEAFYAPYNKELYRMLGKEWIGVWDP